jgi:hypothetical protein
MHHTAASTSFVRARWWCAALAHRLLYKKVESLVLYHVCSALWAFLSQRDEIKSQISDRLRWTDISSHLLLWACTHKIYQEWKNRIKKGKSVSNIIIFWPHHTREPRSPHRSSLLFTNASDSWWGTRFLSPDWALWYIRAVLFNMVFVICCCWCVHQYVNVCHPKSTLSPLNSNQNSLARMQATRPSATWQFNVYYKILD